MQVPWQADFCPVTTPFGCASTTGDPSWASAGATFAESILSGIKYSNCWINCGLLKPFKILITFATNWFYNSWILLACYNAMQLGFLLLTVQPHIVGVSLSAYPCLLFVNKSLIIRDQVLGINHYLLIFVVCYWSTTSSDSYHYQLLIIVNHC